MSTWSCEVCTLVNPTSLNECDACNTPQPGKNSLMSFLPRVSTCKACKQPIFSAMIKALNETYHATCFRCAACQQGFDNSMRFQVHENEPYHSQCYRELYHPRCDICEERLPTNSSELIVYQEMPFWNLKYCAIHSQRDRCCSCKRIEPTAIHRQFDSLSDGRKLCLGCSETVILDTTEVQPVVAEVWAFLASLGMHVPKLPVLLVDFETLNAHTHSHHSNLPRDARVPTVYGVCLSEVRYIRHIAKRGQQERMSLSDRRVNAILLLHGLPYEMTAYILAHEATHAYLRLNSRFPPHLPPKIEEGMCQLMSFLYLRYKTVMANDSSPNFQASLRAYYLFQLQNDPTPIYGDGLREALMAYNTYNSLQQLLDRIAMTQTFG
ncbi:hypothetical protein THRCLA_01147 [Thraustotheca clavata]|uniref:LIM zinc-binding domain-containing protein n=1 Tax=Thraustotheca clavata TaxID=74557 RepID=A0A1W0A961_9STRA|nr:hypothetical protein THRCLA_01147 [Thraustotheca clavata]